VALDHQIDLGQITGAVAAVAAEADGRVPAILAALEGFSAELNTTLGTVQAMVSEENAGRVNRTLAHVETAAAGFATIGTDLADAASQVDALIGRIDALVRTSEGDVSEGLRDAAYVLRSVAQSIDTINNDIEGTTRNMNEFSRQIRQDPGALFDMPWRQEAGYPGGGTR
ncbi:MAG: hypothetical protein HKM95_00665, partial [Inquilinus sp.]|nr:hypothetical protein [Inquilinus sp.]